MQSTVTSARHISRSEKGLIFDELVENMRDIPVVVGNTVTFAATKELMETGIAAVLIGVGPGAACTSREVLGIGVPQVTATIDAAAARDTYYRESGRYVPIITDGGISNGGAMCKAFAAGADAVMLGIDPRRHRRGARPRPPLGHGDAARRAAARHAREGRHRHDAASRRSSARRRAPMAARTSSARCARRWAPAARARSATSRRRRW